MIERRGRRGASKARKLALLVALGAVVAQLVPSAPVVAAPSACDSKAVGNRPVRLCSVTKLSGKKAGYVRVRVTKETQITSEAIAVSGKSKFASFVFQQEGAQQPVTIIGGRVQTETGDQPVLCCGQRTLTPGTIYRLYLISDGAASLTLKLPGLSKGTSRLTPKKITGASIHRPAASALSNNASQYYGAGVTDSVKSGRGLAFTGLWVDNDVHVATASGTCLYHGEVPVDAFAPGCPWRTSELTVWQDATGAAPDTEGFTAGLMTITSGLPNGTYSVGGYATSAGTADKRLTVVVFLELD